MSLDIDFQLKYQNQIIGNQRNKKNVYEDDLTDIFESRTFCLYEDIEKIKKNGLAKGGTKLNFGSYGLKATHPERVTARQIEAARRAITRHLRRAGRVWIRIFPDVPVSSKPAEVRMGKGKGSIEYWACRVKPGRIMFEVDGVNINDAKKAMTLAAAKLPIKCKFVERNI